MSAEVILLNARVGAYLTELDLAPAARRGGGWSVELPSLKRGVIGVGFFARERTVRMTSFVMRARIGAIRPSTAACWSATCRWPTGASGLIRTVTCSWRLT